jgi:hypothetical protein
VKELSEAFKLPALAVERGQHVESWRQSAGLLQQAVKVCACVRARVRERLSWRA